MPEQNNRTRPTQNTRDNQADEVETEPPVSDDTPSPITETPDSSLETISAPDADATQPTVETTIEDTPSTFLSWAIWVVLAALIAAAGAWFWRRRSKAAPYAQEETHGAAPELEPLQVPESIDPALKPITETPQLPEAAAPKKASRKKAVKVAEEAIPAARASLDLEFLPNRAVISLNNLTVSGRMRLINRGDMPARGLQLRIALTSASEQQAQIISLFHNDTQQFAPKELDDIPAGADIDMTIELGIALTDLQSFTVNGQKLFVPMLLANVAYGWDAGDGADAVQFACLIGREAKPPQPRMGPLRLDLGPRSFADLGQRPLAA